MSSAADWATTIRVVGKLHPPRQQRVGQDEPPLLIQRIASNLYVCGGPTEQPSQDIRVWSSATPEEEALRPIDVLYGRYEPESRLIDIFVKSIRQDASLFGAEPDDLLEIVRIHEHAHAVVHLGERSPSWFGESGQTSGAPLLNERTAWFVGLPDDVPEFLAQALTYAALSHLSLPGRSQRLQGVFDALEAKQPLQYKLSPLVKQCAARADWPLILDAARGAINPHRGQGFTLRAGLEELVCAASDAGARGDAP